MRWLYTFSIYLYRFAAYIFAIWNKKARTWVKAQLRWKQQFKNFNPDKKKVVWFHCASLGEFEQGRPIIEAIRKQQPNFFILVSFFSPSGYEIRKDYNQADLVVYMPDDTLHNSKKFVAIVNPVIAFFIKYEFWFNFIYQLKQNHTKIYSVSSLFRSGQLFFKPYGFWFRKHLKLFDQFFVQNHQSFTMLNKININKCTRTGDTRYDRVRNIANASKKIDLVKEFTYDKKVVVAGSTWPADINILTGFINQSTDNTVFVIAPHEIHEKNLSQIEDGINGSVIRYSMAKPMQLKKYKALVIDNIGMLASLYRYGHVAYIGGGFGKGIHNTLEAVVYGMPVLFGPNYQKFDEARQMVTQEIGYPVNNSEEASHLLHKLLYNNNLLSKKQKATEKFISANLGATEIVMDSIDI